MTLTNQTSLKVTNNPEQQGQQSLDLVSLILVVVIMKHPHHHLQHVHQIDRQDVWKNHHMKIHIHLVGVHVEVIIVFLGFLKH